jgi:hypothetical protein
MNSVHEKMAYDQAAADAVESGPRSYEESAQYQVKSSLCEQWLQKKYQGR